MTDQERPADHGCQGDSAIVSDRPILWTWAFNSGLSMLSLPFDADFKEWPWFSRVAALLLAPLLWVFAIACCSTDTTSRRICLGLGLFFLAGDLVPRPSGGPMPANHVDNYFALSSGIGLLIASIVCRAHRVGSVSPESRPRPRSFAWLLLVVTLAPTSAPAGDRAPSGVTAEISTERRTYLLGEPVPVKLTVRNESTSPVKALYANNDDLNASVAFEGKPFHHLYDGRGTNCIGREDVELKPGDRWIFHLELNWDVYGVCPSIQDENPQPTTGYGLVKLRPN